MRVEQQQKNNIAEFIQQGIETEGKAGTVSFEDKITMNSSRSGTASVNLKDATYLKPGTEEKKTAVEEIEEASAMDAAERKDQMTVLSNTTSEEDYAKMQEDGFSLDQTTANTIVTVTDKIKAVLAKAGVDISCFGDELSRDQLEALTGSPELAVQLAAALRESDLPLTNDNLKDAGEAAELAQALKIPGDGALKYMLDNQLEPTIGNLYLAENSGSVNYTKQMGGELDISSFSGQIEQVIRQAELPVNEDTFASSRWLLENDIPLTAENLKYLDDLKNMSYPIDSGIVSTGVAEAIAEGRRPQDALLIPEYRLKYQAQRTAETVSGAEEQDLEYIVNHGMELNAKNLRAASENRTAREEREAIPRQASQTAGAGADTEVTEMPGPAAGVVAVSGSDTIQTEEPVIDLTGQPEYTQKGLSILVARRQLEEARLVMTVQANYSLLKQGFSIDTEPLVKLVEALRADENAYYSHLLSSQGAQPSDENIAIFRETSEKMAEMKAVPAYVLGIKDADEATINAVHRAGTALKDVFIKANQRYETLMTRPNEELGDSIQKAFQNIDDILADLGLEASEANCRAVRILGYNQAEITESSIMQMKAADEVVQRVFHNMTPAVVTQMIKRGINPLEMEFEELNAAAEQIQAESGDQDTKKFSEYLWKLEQNHEINEEERSSYIGIYRLVHQVEDTDGAAVGALVNQGAELTMKNLLTAMRSERRSGKMDYAVDDSTQGFINTGYQGTSISNQIEASYQNNCLKDVADLMTPEKMRAVLEQNWEDMTPEQLKEALNRVRTNDPELDQAYAKEQMASLEECAKASQDIYHVLQKYDIPNTVSNILAMQSMVKDRNQVFRQIFGKAVKKSEEETSPDDLDEIRKELLEEFGEAVSEPQALAKAQEQLGELAENVMKTMMESDEVTSLDIREMRMLSAKLSLNVLLAKEEQYSVPVLVGDGIVNVSLKIVRGADKKGVVDIMMESELRGKIAAAFQTKQDGISGFVAASEKETRELLSEGTDALADQLKEEETDVKIHCAYIKDLDFNHFSMGLYGVDADSATGENSNDENYKVQTARLYHIAETFIRTIKEVL